MKLNPRHRDCRETFDSRGLVKVLVFESKSHDGLEDAHVGTGLDNAPEMPDIFIVVVETGWAEDLAQLSTP